MNTPEHGRVVVYRCYNAAGDLLYIGHSKGAAQRMRTHTGTTKWWHEVARVDFKPHETEQAARIAETMAIRAEAPRYNKNYQRPEHPAFNDDLFMETTAALGCVTDEQRATAAGVRPVVIYKLRAGKSVGLNRGRTMARCLDVSWQELFIAPHQPRRARIRAA